MTKNLVIVESPAKAKTIEKFLGKDFIVKSCFGHIRDLAKGDGAIDIKNRFMPKYEVSDDKVKVVTELKKLSKAAETIWLASDEDREGEAISWHLSEVLGLDAKNTKRIVFHEITKPAILKAIENPRTIDKNLVDAQQARRVLDRLVGFELSPVLWKKIKGNLSAGRVQSVAVRLIVEREREINHFNSTSAFKITARFNVGNKIMNAELPKRFATEKEAETFVNTCNGATFTINNLEVKPAKKSPAPPFTTSTLQQEASRKLGFSVSTTMSVAQKLYEAGYITYMRTDSVNLSDLAIGAAKNQITSQYGAEFSHVRKYTTKSASAQEAHEAIRPTYFENAEINGTKQEQRLYELIWKRAIASQMADAQLERTIATIGISTSKEELIAQGEVLKFEGFLKVYLESHDDEQDEENSSMLPPLRVGETLSLKELEAVERFSKPAARYTEASLVKKLEELGIGRPSTYAPTISTIQKRGYVAREDREGKERSYKTITLNNGNISNATKTERYGAEKSKLFPSDIGMIVTDFLSKHFDNIMDYNFTATVEKEFDEIAQGQLEWNKMIEQFYKPFHEDVERTTETAERQSGERTLGTDPATGKTVYAKVGKFGPFVQLGENSEDEKPQYGKLLQNQRIDTITLEEALELFKLPRTLGSHEDKEVSVNIGRFGPYVKWGEDFISLPKGVELMEVELDNAIEVIKQKQSADAPVGEYNSKPITKGKGRFGPFIKWNDLFINVPRAYNYDTLTQAEMNELIEKKIAKEASRFIQQWEDEKIAIENGRWGAFIRFGKAMIKIGRKADGEKYTAEDLAGVSLDEVKKLIEAEQPEAFTKKSSAKKTTAKKTAVKKVAAKKTAKKEINSVMLNENEVKSLVALLDDDDAEIVQHVEDKLLTLGNEVVPILENEWGLLNSSDHQYRVENIIHRIQFKHLLEKLRMWSKEESPELLDGILIVAQYRYPDLDKQAITNEIDRIRLDIWLEMHYDLTGFEKVRIINQVLYNIHGFKGNTDHYHDPQNSFINVVLENKRGNPIMLAVIYMLIAQRLNIPIYGVNLPQHFVLAYLEEPMHLPEEDYFNTTNRTNSNEGRVLFYINAFNLGSVFSRSNLEQFLRQIQIEPRLEYFETCNNIEIIKRVLRNLVVAYEKLNKPAKVKEVHEMLAILGEPPLENFEDVTGDNNL